MSEHGKHPNYLAIWGWLMFLLAVGLGASFLTGSRTLAVVILFGTAGIKAFLVAWNYMHLRREGWLIYALAIIPLLFVLGLLVALLPDFVFHPLHQ